MTDKCKYCQGEGWWVGEDIEADCCGCPLESGECCGIPIGVQVQIQVECQACEGTGSKKV